MLLLRGVNVITAPACHSVLWGCLELLRRSTNRFFTNNGPDVQGSQVTELAPERPMRYLTIWLSSNERIFESDMFYVDTLLTKDSIAYNALTMLVPLKTRPVNITYDPRTFVLVNETDLEKDLPEWDKVEVFKRNAIRGVTSVGKLSDHIDSLEGLDMRWSETVGVEVSHKILQSKMLEQVYALSNTKRALVEPKLLLRADLPETLATYNAQQKILRTFEGAQPENTANTGFSHVKLLRDRPNAIADALYTGLAQIDQPARHRILDLPEFKEFTSNNELRSEVFDVIAYGLAKGEVPLHPLMLQETRIIFSEIAGINPAAYAQWHKGRNVEKDAALEEVIRERAPEPSEIRANHKEPLPNAAYNVVSAYQKLETLTEGLENYDTPAYFNEGLPLIINDITKGKRYHELDRGELKQLSIVDHLVQGKDRAQGLYTTLLEVNDSTYNALTSSKGFRLLANYVEPSKSDYGVGLDKLTRLLAGGEVPVPGSGSEAYAKRLSDLAKLNPEAYGAALDERVAMAQFRKRPVDSKTQKYLRSLQELPKNDLAR